MIKEIKKQHRITSFIKMGILPSEDIDEFSDIQKEIYYDICNNPIDTKQLCYKYLDYANNNTKRLYVHKRILLKNSIEFQNKGLCINITPDDIIMNEYCPFFETKIVYGPGGKKGTSLRSPYLYGIDRMDNSKGYVKGNVWTISRLANTIKLNATLDELKTFCKNIIKIYNKPS